MAIKYPKRLWLAVGALALLSASAVAQLRDRDDDKRGCSYGNRDRRCQQVADGGSSAGYVLMVAGTCLGAMIVSSRRRKSLQS